MLVDRSDIAKKMRDMGFLYRDIGELFGISKQRAHQLATGYRSPSKGACSSRYKKAHPEQVKEAGDARTEQEVESE